MTVEISATKKVFITENFSWTKQTFGYFHEPLPKFHRIWMSNGQEWWLFVHSTGNTATFSPKTLYFAISMNHIATICDPRKSSNYNGPKTLISIFYAQNIKTFDISSFNCRPCNGGSTLIFEFFPWQRHFSIISSWHPRRRHLSSFSTVPWKPALLISFSQPLPLQCEHFFRPSIR